MLCSCIPFPFPLTQKEKRKRKRKEKQKAQSTFPIHHGPYYPEVIHIPIPNYTYLLHITYQNLYT